MTENKRLKIGYLVKYFHPIKGGAENNILNLALKAHEDGHEVHIFTSDRKGDQRVKELEEEYKGLKIHRCRMWIDITLYLGFYPSLLVRILKADLDVIHVSGFGFIWHDFVLILKKVFSRRTKFINTPHGPFMALSDYNLILNTFRGIYTFVQRLFLNWLYDTVIQVNTFQWQWIVEYGIEKDKIIFVPNGISEEILKLKITNEQKRNFRKKYKLGGKKIVSYLGRISKYKGVQDIIKIIPRTLKIGTNVQFLIMGRDEGYIRELNSLAEKEGVKENVTFIIDVSEKEKFIALEVSQIFIFPSEWEAFGIVLAEAMSRWNAVISTKTEGGKYLITEKENGLLYDFGKLRALFESLKTLLSDNELVLKMQKRNRKKIQKFTWEKIYKQNYRKILVS